VIQPPHSSTEHAAGPGQGIRPDPRLAQWWRRLLCWITDTIIIGIPAVALWIPAVHACVNNRYVDRAG